MNVKILLTLKDLSRILASGETSLNPPRFEIFEESKHDSFRFPWENRRRIRTGAVTVKRGGKKYQGLVWNYPLHSARRLGRVRNP